MQVFTKDQLHYIAKGQESQMILKNVIDEALFNNRFGTNFIISSLPGLGKSFEMHKAMKNLTTPHYLVEGSASMVAFTIDVATAIYLANGQHLTIILDDCDMLFEDKNLNITKKMFDDARSLNYNKNYRRLKGLCTELQYSALEHFGSDDRAGLSIPVNNTTFIILTNRHFPTINEVEELDAGSSKSSKAVDLHSIRRRTEGETISMDNNALWGYVTNVVINEQICEKNKPNITINEKQQIVNWLYPVWDKTTERNLSLIEKMTRDMVRFPTNYIDIWTKKYLQK